MPQIWLQNWGHRECSTGIVWGEGGGRVSLLTLWVLKFFKIKNFSFGNIPNTFDKPLEKN